MSWGAIAGAAISVVGGAVASNKAKKNAAKTATYDPVNFQDEQVNALGGNLSAQSAIEALLSRADQFSADQQLSLEDKTMPGYANLRKQLTDTSTSLLDNPYELPKDVEQNLSRIAAERGISAGTRGQFNDFSLLRDFGINSLQYGASRIGQAQGIAGLLAQVSPKVNPMSPLSFYVTPQQNAGNATNNNQTQQAIAQGTINAQNLASQQSNASLWANLTNLAGTGIGAYNNRNTTERNNYPIGSSSSINGVSPAGAH